MSYHDKVSNLAADAAQLEHVYHAAQKEGQAVAFKDAIEASHTTAPDNLLYAAWFHRLNYAAEQAKSFVIAWPWVIPLALLNGLLFWWLSDENRFMVEVASAPGEPTLDFAPVIVLLMGPLSALFMLVYLAVVGRKNWKWGTGIALLLIVAGIYVLWLYLRAGTVPFQEQYLALMAMHLPLLAWIGLGAFVTKGVRTPANRFAFLTKSLELFIVGGLFVIAGGLFTAISFGLFESLDVDLPTVVERLFLAGGGGLIPIVALAIVYDPTVAPAEQAFDEGLSKLAALLMRVLLPLTLFVLLVFLALIPFNFRAPFDNRDVLVTYNGMLFAVVVLLVGATPLRMDELAPRLTRWLRRGIVAVAALALLVSIYALAAIVYRTALDRLTPNRLTFIGWNVINIGLLVLVLFYQTRAKAGQWLPALYRAYSAGTMAYAVWTVVVILTIPWVFGIDRAAVETLPRPVQKIVYEEPSPILLKCGASPHIYLLDSAEKRWLEDIDTFTARGYVWRDVHAVTCSELRSIPDGPPIPADAGPPPQP